MVLSAERRRRRPYPFLLFEGPAWANSALLPLVDYYEIPPCNARKNSSFRIPPPLCIPPYCHVYLADSWRYIRPFSFLITDTVSWRKNRSSGATSFGPFTKDNNWQFLFFSYLQACAERQSFLSFSVVSSS
jgi:hypothetical protein